MAEKILKTRIQLKYDTLANWESIKDTFVPKKGEVCIVEVPTDKTGIAGDTARPQLLMKVGDGTTKWGALNWVSGKAADVYAWAKAANKPTYSASEVGADPAGTAAGLVNGLDVSDTAVTGQYVSAVKQENGKIVVTRTNLPSGFILQEATDASLGGMKTGYIANGRNYSVKLDDNGDAYINVPWTDTNTDTKVTQTILDNNTANGDYRILLTPAGQNSTQTTTANFATELSYNPSTDVLSAKKVKLAGDPTENLQAATKQYVDSKVAGATQYLGTVGTADALAALNPGKGDFVRVSAAFNGYHPSDMLICETPKNGSTAATWSVIHGEIDSNTWVANSKTAAGYVAAGGSNANKVWKTDGSGNPGWRDDANTIYSHPAGSAPSKTSGLYKFSTDANSHISAVTPVTKADIIALGIPGQDTTYTAGDGIDIDSDNIISVVTSYTTNGKNYAVNVDPNSSGLYVNVPWTDTHYQAKNVVGASATVKANAAVTSNGVYLNLVENDTIRSTHKITGAGTAKVTSDTSGNITVTTSDQYKGTVTSVSTGTGLKVTQTASVNPKVEIDDSIVFVLDGGSATENI